MGGGNTIRTVRDMKRGQKCRIVRLREGNSTSLRKMMVLGLIPGEQLDILQTFPAYVIQVGRTQVAFDRNLAILLEVEMMGE